MTSAAIAVIGAGLTGLTFARELANHGVQNVTLFEAGSDMGYSHKDVLDSDESLRFWQGEAVDSNFRRRWTTDRPPHFLRGCGIRERIGGRSLYWHGVCIEIEDSVFQSGAWPLDITAALGGVESDGLYSEVREELELWLGCSFSSCHGIREEALLSLLRGLGYSAAMPVPQATAVRTVDGVVRQIPFSPLEYWRSREGPLQKLPPIVPNRRLQFVELLKEGVLSLHFTPRHGEGDVTATHVVLAAGTFENTRIVAESLMKLTGTSELIFPGLSDHIVQGFVATVPRQVLSLPPGIDRAFCYVPLGASASSNLFFQVLPNYRGFAETVIVWAIGEQTSKQGCIRVSSGIKTSVCAEPRITEGDLQVVDDQCELLRKAAISMLGFGQGLNLGRDGYRRGSPTYMSAFYSATRQRQDGRGLVRLYPYVYPLGSVDHEGGSLALGTVLTSEGNLPSLPAITVTGPSVFPRAGAANPSLTSMALAKWQARILAKSAGVRREVGAVDH